jgi:uncharacterized protein (TIGR00369 family)
MTEPTPAMSPWPPEGWLEYRMAEDRKVFDDLVGPLYCAPANRTGVKAFALRPQPELQNFHGVIHGGVLMTVVDTMMGYLLKEAIDGRSCATISLTTDFISAAAAGDVLEGEAQLIRIGRSVAFTQARISCGNRLVVAASAKWSIAQVG